MKKQIGKRLSLSKETLRNLSERELEGVVGGWPTQASCNNSCDPYTTRICPSAACTVNCTANSNCC